MLFFFFGRKFIAGRSWEIIKIFIKYIKNFSKIFKKFWELDRKIFSPVWVSSVFRLGWVWKTRVKRLLHFFSHLHNYETFRHIYTRQSSEQLDIFELARVLHVLPFVGVVGQSDSLTIRQAQQKANSVPSATIFTAYRKNGFPTDGASFPVDNNGPNGVVQAKTCQSSNLVFWLLTMWALVCYSRGCAYIKDAW